MWTLNVMFLIFHVMFTQKRGIFHIIHLFNDSDFLDDLFHMIHLFSNK